MNKPVCGCPYEPVHALQITNVREDLRDVKERVAHLEGTLARGVLLLVANLVAVVATLTQQVLAQ